MNRFAAFWLAWRDASALEEARDIATQAVTMAQEVRAQRDHLVAVNLRQRKRIVTLTEELAERDRFERAFVEAFQQGEAL